MSSEDEEDGPMSTETYQRLNENWELRRRIIAESDNIEIDIPPERDSNVILSTSTIGTGSSFMSSSRNEPEEEEDSDGEISTEEVEIRPDLNDIMNLVAGIQRRKRKQSDEDSSDSDDTDSSTSSQASEAEIDSEDERDFIQQLFPQIQKSDGNSQKETKIEKRTNQKRPNLTRLVRGREINSKCLKRRFHTEAAERFRMEGALPGHDGCVNAIGWSESGKWLISGSDDQKICIHDPFSNRNEPLQKLPTDHLSNIFQTKFLPYSNDRVIISSARDGLVSMSILDQTGQLVRHSAQKYGKQIIKHRKSCHKICFIPSTQIILSCGEDGAVYRYDPRERDHSDPKPIVQYRCPNHHVFGTQLHTIDFSPNGHNFAIGGHYHSASVFDYRKLDSDQSDGNQLPIMEIYPFHMEKLKQKPQCPNITALRYNYSGNEIICSYNDEEIHLFNSLDGNHVRTFGGHRNSQTVKGVNFYGKCSEYIISGSDCGHLFVWKTRTGSLVNYQFADGDEEMEPGVLNALEPHPYLPYLATSGLDSTVKLWSPFGINFLDEPDGIVQSAKKGAMRNRRNRLSFKDSNCDISQLSAVVRLLSHRFTDRHFEEDDSDEDEEPSDCRPS